MRAEEWLIDIAGADARSLASAEAARALCDDVVAAFGLVLVAPPLSHAFPETARGPGGVTVLCLLSESHVALHTWPERGAALLSLGTCKAGVRDGTTWAPLVHARFGPCDVRVRRIERAIGAET